MKILLTGGFGNIGIKLIKKFYKKYDLIVFTTKNSIKNFNKKNYEFRSLKIEEGRVESKKIFSVIKKHKPDIIIHLAALGGLKTCQEKPKKAFDVNVFGTYNVCKAAIEHKSMLIFLSSREVYGETIGRYTKESDPFHPNNIYGITKAVAENIIQVVSYSFGLKYSILRVTNVYGPNMGDTGVNRIFKTAVNKKLISINGGEQLVNLIYIDDLMDIINLIIHNKKSPNSIYNVGSEETLKIKEFVDLVLNSIKNDVHIEYLPKIEYETLNFRPNLNKLNKKLNFHSKINLKTGIKNTINWYIEKGKVKKRH